MPIQMRAGLTAEKWITEWLNSIPQSEFRKDDSGVYYALSMNPINSAICLVRERYGKRMAMECAVISDGFDAMTAQALMQRARALDT